VSDVVFRRTDLAFLGGVERRTLEVIGAALGEILGWSATRRAREIEACVAEFETRHGTPVPARARA
jgi:glycerol-3-phosphate dehydrogenase